MRPEDLTPGMEVEVLSPYDRERGFAPQWGRVLGVGVHRVVNADTGLSGMVTVDLGMGVHEYVPVTWLTQKERS